MNGGPCGKVRIPDNLADDWLEEMARQLDRGVSMFWAEKKTLPVFKLFVDLDIKGRLPGVSDLQVAQALQQEVVHYFQNIKSPTALLCTSTNPQKRGCHITWDNVFVDSMTALAMRDRWLHVCGSTWGSLTPSHEETRQKKTPEWTDIIDACVYTSNGLRMLWCQKSPDQPHYYVPHAVLEGEEQVVPVSEKDYKDDRQRYLKMASIRTMEKRASTNILDSANLMKQMSKKRKAAVDEAVECHDAEELFDMMRQTLPPCYRDAKLTVWKKSMVRGSPCWRVKSTSKFCINVNREHTSSNVWFQVTPHDIRQRCYCKRETLHGRNFSMCKDFVSPPIPFRPRFTKALQALSNTNLQASAN